MLALIYAATDPTGSDTLLSLFGPWAVSLVILLAVIAYLVKQLSVERAKNDAINAAMLQMAEKTLPALTQATAMLGEATRELGRHDP